MRISALIHADIEQPGYFVDYCKLHGYALRIVNAHLNEPMPDLNDFDALLILGGPQTPRRLNDYPFLQDEINLIQAAINVNKKVLGVCLGAQLIAESYGAATEKSPEREIGMHEITLTNAGEHDAMLGDFTEDLIVAHWHSDMPGLPETARVLAVSDGCPRQIIRFAPHAYGFQCHLEFTAKDIKAIYDSCGKAIEPSATIQSQTDFIKGPFEPMHQYLHYFLDRFWEQP